MLSAKGHRQQLGTICSTSAYSEVSTGGVCSQKGCKLSKLWYVTAFARAAIATGVGITLAGCCSWHTGSKWQEVSCLKLSSFLIFTKCVLIPYHSHKVAVKPWGLCITSYKQIKLFPSHTHWKLGKHEETPRLAGKLWLTVSVAPHKLSGKGRHPLQ